MVNSFMHSATERINPFPTRVTIRSLKAGSPVFIYCGSSECSTSGTSPCKSKRDKRICGCGGIGRLGGFRFLCLRRAGSSPVIRTRKRKTSRKTCLSFSTKSVLSDGINPSSMDEITCVMKSDFVGLGDGFNFICEADFIQAPLGFHRERKRTISLKTNGYVRVRIHTQKQQKYLFCNPKTRKKQDSNIEMRRGGAPPAAAGRSGTFILLNGQNANRFRSASSDQQILPTGQKQAQTGWPFLVR